MKSKTFKTPERINERIIMLFEGKEYYLRKCVKITDWAGCCPSLPSLSLCWGLGIWGDCAPEKAVWSSSHQSGLPDESLTWSLRTGGHFRRGHFSSDSLNTWQHLLSVSLSHRLQLPPAPRPAPPQAPGGMAALPIFTSGGDCCSLTLKTALPLVGFPKTLNTSL